MMPSGLAIYETTLMPHTKNMRYVLGGPHSSFDVLLTRYPDANLLMQHFSEGIAKWKALGPASLTQYVMSDNELNSALKNNLAYEDMENYIGLITDTSIIRENYEAEEITVNDLSLGLRCEDCDHEITKCMLCQQ